MYTRYFGLKEKPFTIAPDPRYLYMSEMHREALAHLLYGIHNDGCLILLTGDVGTGKTTVCRCLLAQLAEKTDIAIILNPKLTIIELFKTICRELSISVRGEPSTTGPYIDVLNRYLLNAHSEGRNTVLIVDEAQNLDVEILEQLRLLTNLETDTHKLLQIVLLGQPELRDMLSSPQLTQINQRVTSRYHLQPLQPEDVEKYIRHRIYIAGGSATSLFAPQAIKYIARVSKGVPRTINLLCDRALLGAYAEHKDRVDLKITKKAAHEVTANTGHPRLSGKQLALAILLFLLGVCLPAGLYFSAQKATTPADKKTTTKLPAPGKHSDSNMDKQTPRERKIIINPVELNYETKKITNLSNQ
ncbi:MAG: AAA family ATPase [Deltaproteobacteria bacterium]|nr:AAA family ATPase [Deltaproteobacteria bacterium]